MKNHYFLLQLSFAISFPLSADAAVVGIVDYGAASASEQASFDLINRFRVDPVNELARMFNDNFSTSHTNATLGTLLSGQNYSANFWTNTFGSNIVSNSMDFFQTRPGTLYSEFQALTPATAYSWSNNIGWAAHQYSMRVELDAGASPNPHAVAGAPSLGARFTNAGVNWTGVGENIAANWPASPAAMHMALAVDWGTGTFGMQNPRGHRDSMMSTSFNSAGIGTLDAGWAAGSVTQVQHLANASLNSRIAYGFVYTDTSATTRAVGATVNIYDAANNVIGSGTTDSIGAYTVTLAANAATPVSADYTLGPITTPRHTLGNNGITYFLDAAVIPEPSSMLLVGMSMLGLCSRRQRAVG
ncbi:MAG: PEP-CTERM sorting domain-containing protein [Verrucomicrobia bacterium]|nr:MAG: PEP-CTERM sorting domain-containing protein [Verrucomicrobiota bacterium]